VSPQTDKRVSLIIKNNIAYVELSRPEKHNALDMAMFKQIVDVQKQIKKQPSVRVVIVSGQGESFCSGLDVKSVLSNPVSGLKLLFKWLPGNANLAQKVSVGWRRLKVPVIMVLHGKCWGGGMQIALGGDFRIAAPQTSLSIMEAKWGLIPDMGGTLALRECMSADQAKRLAMTANVIEATDAQAVGLISQVAEQPLDAANLLAEQLINRSPDVVNKIKSFYSPLSYWQERRLLSQETMGQIKILMGKNQRIAVVRETKKVDKPYFD